MSLREFWCRNQLNQERTAFMSVLGLFLCVRLTLILAEAQHVPGAARRGLRRLAGDHLTRHQRLHVPDRPRPGEQ